MAVEALPLVLLTLLSVGLFVTGLSIVLVFAVWVIGFSLLNPVLPLTNLSIGAYDQLDTFPFIAVPLFIAVGTLLNRGGIARKLIEFFRSFMGRVPGGSANVTVYTAGTISAITGSNAATTAAVGEAMHDVLVEEDYDPHFSAATIAAGGILGVIIPPSVLFIIYGITFNVPVVDLFKAGMLPGLLMVVGLSVTASVISRRQGYGATRAVGSSGEILRKLWGAKSGFGAIIVLLGGIYAGVFTPTESSIAGLVYLIASALLSRELTDPRVVFESIYRAGLLTALIAPLLVTSIAIQQALTFLGLQEVVSAAILTLQGRWAIILAIMAVVLFAGMILDSLPNMILTAPLLAPAALGDPVGLTPLMWGVIFMIGDAIGFITPPYGLNLYIISGITELDYLEVAREVVPYLGVLILIWLLFFAFPEALVIVT